MLSILKVSSQSLNQGPNRSVNKNLTLIRIVWHTEIVSNAVRTESFENR